MDDRERILKNIRGQRNTLTSNDSLNAAAATSSPSNSDDSHDNALIPIQYESKLDKAKEMIVSVGGKVIEKGSAEYGKWKMPEDSLMIKGEFLVAENGTIWVVPPNEMERSELFLAEHLVIQVPRDQVVHNMHEAYSRLKGLNFSYGTFISGPSKTADIEQSLVIGAQGPKSCMVILT